MADYPRSRDDLLLDGIVAKIAAQRDIDAQAIPATYYEVARELNAPWQDLTKPLVNVEIETDTPQGRDYVARYHAACFVPIAGDADIASIRLAMLKEQVRVALRGLDRYDFDQPVGTVSLKSFPTWRRVAFDDAELALNILVGEWAFEFVYSWQPAPLDGPALSEISVTLGERFAALYQLGGN